MKTFFAIYEMKTVLVSRFKDSMFVVSVSVANSYTQMSMHGWTTHWPECNEAFINIAVTAQRAKIPLNEQKKDARVYTPNGKNKITNI